MIVAKMGGSVLRRPEAADRLRSWADRQSDPILAVAGGGESADVVRAWAARFGLGDRACHALALRAMSLQTALVADLTGWPIVADAVQWGTNVPKGVVLLDCAQFFAQPTAPTVPHSWEVTSDSLAAVVGNQVAATRFVLLKSVGGPEPFQLSDAIERQWIDPYFPHAVGTMNITWHNLESGFELELSTLDR